MTQFLPPNLLALFAPRDPIPYLPPASKLPHEKKNGGYIGVGSFVKYFEVHIISFDSNRAIIFRKPSCHERIIFIIIFFAVQANFRDRKSFVERS